MAMASSAAAPSAVGRSSTSTCSWRLHWWSCANSFNGHASAIVGRLARLRAVSSSAYCRALLAMALHDMGDYDQAATVLRQGLAAFRDDLGHQRFGLHFMPAVNPRVWLARCLVARGEFAEAAALADEALRIAEAADHPFSLVSALQAVGVRHLLQGDL